MTRAVVKNLMRAAFRPCAGQFLLSKALEKPNFLKLRKNTMKKIFLALMLVAASMNVVACASRSAQQDRTVTEESHVTEMSERTEAAQMESNDSLRK